MESHGNAVALDCLNAAIDGSRIPRKVLADHLGISEAQFSKLTSGVQAFGVGHLDKLPAAIRSDFLRRMSEAHDEETRERIVLERALHAIVDALVILRGRSRMAKAGL